MKMDDNSVRQQSLNAYNQWKEQWRKHASHHSKHAMKSLDDFNNTGVGRAILCIATGFSFEQELETIKKHRDNVDIICCDKSLKSCLENGITPDFCMVADANVDYETYLKPIQDQLQDVTLFVNVCGNPQWTDNGNWKDIYFLVNKDVINSEIEFSRLSGCKNVIPAGTNVSNAMIILLTQSDNDGRRNFFGYDKILLIGYDYSWTPDGSYYAFNKDGGGKHNYMRHVFLINRAGDLCYSSNNLIFSARWIEKYISTFNLLVVSCTENTILTTQYSGNLDEQMRYCYKREDKKLVSNLSAKRARALEQLKEIDIRLKTIGKDHYRSFRASV